jgi:hypothetical protein
MPDKEMPKKDFEQLKIEIELAMDKVSDLNKLYRGQTGQDFVKPLRLSRLSAEPLTAEQLISCYGLDRV